MHKRLHLGLATRHFMGATASLGLLLGANAVQAQTMYGLGTLTQAVPLGSQFYPAGAPAGAQALIT
ncbi:MAG: hypothetical protein EOO62_16410, partial [Hymenobacter sp.]